jgi:hypothetical protein
MANDAFLCGYRVLLPGAEAILERITPEALTGISMREQDFAGVFRGRFADLTVPHDHPLGPEAKDVKAIRMDTHASILVVAELMAGSGLDPELIPFIHAGDSAYGSLYDEVSRLYQTWRETRSLPLTEQRRQLTRRLHPLFPLRLLPNAASCWVPNRVGFRGSHQVMGTSVWAGWMAVYEGIRRVQSGEAEHVVVSVAAANAESSSVGFAAPARSPGEGEVWISSGCAVALLLASEGPGVRLRNLRQDLAHDDQREGRIAPAGDFVYCGGPGTFQEQRRLADSLRCRGVDTWDAFGELGTVGPAMLPLLTALASERLTASEVYIRDSWGREACLGVGG